MIVHERLQCSHFSDHEMCPPTGSRCTAELAKDEETHIIIHGSDSPLSHSASVGR